MSQVKAPPVQGGSTTKNPDRPSTHTMQHTSSSTYANITSSILNPSFPTKEQAIVLTAIQGPTVNEYVKAIGDLTGPQAITYVSRLAYNRICIFLSSVKVVDDLLKVHDKVTIRSNDIPIRRLVTPAKRLIISNAAPYIPHDVVAAELRTLGLKPVSQMSFLRAGLGDEYRHVLSFRRQIYVAPLGEDSTLPDSLVIRFADTTHRVFLTFDTMTCYLCKGPGHIAVNCPNGTQNDPDPTPASSNVGTEQVVSNTNPIPDPPPQSELTFLSATQTTEEDEGQPMDLSQERTQLERGQKLPNIQTTYKRPISTCSTTSTPDAETVLPAEGSQFTPPLPPPPSNARKSKKLKRSSSTAPPDFSESLENIKKVMEERPDQFIFSYNALKCFIENSYHNTDLLSEAAKFTESIPGLLQTLTELHPHATGKSLKRRLTVLIKRIKAQRLKEEEPEAAYDSDTSASDVFSQKSY